MEPQEAIQKAQAHLQNAMEIMKSPLGENLLYMWDNQVTAMDDFLAETEAIADQAVKTWRSKMRDAKQKLTDAIIAFEAKQEGEEVPEDDSSDEEKAQDFLEMAGEMTNLVREALEEKVKDVQDLVKWEDPLSMVNGYLADSEPYQELSRDLRKARSVVRVARRDLKGRIDDVFAHWREADMKAGD